MPHLERWIVEQGLRHADVRVLLAGVADGLVAEGIPLLRAYIALPTVNPTIRVFNHIWTRTGGAQVEGVSHERDQSAFERSPFGLMIREGVTERHWHLGDRASAWFDVFDELQAQGATDYLARLVPYESAEAPALRGMAASFSTDRPGGLQPEEVARIDALLPLLALAAYRMALFNLTLAIVDTYVGFSAGRRVLSGEIQRGSGQTLRAALLIADLRGFTAAADTGGAGLIGLLDEHLEAMAAPVLAHGGEILKFLGDGLLAAFPIHDGRTEEEACRAAVQAAREAVSANRALNGTRGAEPELPLDVALHCGEVFYGNIGSAQRLDFTVIGPAVNEASRIEALCGPLGCSILMSSVVAAATPYPTRSLGRHALRGVGEERELFTLA
ncbi:MAG TPA: adenylate/guanylate cyclase domain-containing protein [Microvirga sp.]|jgi:adenylate cyclase